MLDTADYTPRLRALYDEKIRAAMKEEFAYKNDMQIPRLDKIVLNIGAGKAAVKDSKKGQICASRSVDNCWSAGGYHQGKEIYRGLPGA